MSAKNVKKRSDARRIKQMEDVSTRVSLYAQAETTRKLQVKSEMFVVRSPTALGSIPGSVHRSLALSLAAASFGLLTLVRSSLCTALHLSGGVRGPAAALV